MGVSGGYSERWGADEWLHATVELQARQGGRCACCRRFLTDLGVRHHRQMRSHGGADSLDNLVLLLPEHHLRVHANPEWARAHGLLVSMVGDPAATDVVACRAPIGTCEHYSREARTDGGRS